MDAMYAEDNQSRIFRKIHGIQHFAGGISQRIRSVPSTSPYDAASQSKVSSLLHQRNCLKLAQPCRIGCINIYVSSNVLIS